MHKRLRMTAYELSNNYNNYGQSNNATMRMSKTITAPAKSLMMSLCMGTRISTNSRVSSNILSI